MFKAILFDLDDTLIYYDDYWEAAVRDAFLNYALTKGIDIDSLIKEYLKNDRHFLEAYYQKKITLKQYRISRFTDTLIKFGIKSDRSDYYQFEQLLLDFFKNLLFQMRS